MTTDPLTALVRPAQTKVVLYVFDGLGGLPNSRGRTELEDAHTNSLDRMAEAGSLGQLVPVGPGITPGPATAFLALLGYDPLKTSIEEGTRLQPFNDRWQLKAAVVTASELHQALAQRVRLDVIEADAEPAALVEAMAERWDDFECFVVHYKTPLPKTMPELFAEKRTAIGKFDAAVPAILRLEPDVLIVTGDRSSPAVTGSDSWHPVPLLLTGASTLPDETHHFSELGCARGVLGAIPACDVLRVALAHAGRLAPFGS